MDTTDAGPEWCADILFCQKKWKDVWLIFTSFTRKFGYSFYHKEYILKKRNEEFALRLFKLNSKHLKESLFFATQNYYFYTKKNTINVFT